jgi:hypothetical protein
MTTPVTPATEILRQLSADEIRARLEAIEAEQKALRTLLRAAVQLERKQGATK